MMLLFPVIAWYDIIIGVDSKGLSLLLFPVIAWYDIIASIAAFKELELLFPVIAWYDIIGNEKSPCLLRSRGFFM